MKRLVFTTAPKASPRKKTDLLSDAFSDTGVKTYLGKRVSLKGFLLLLLSVDAAFIVLAILLPPEVDLGLEKERGYPEMFLYIQEALIMLLMAMAAVRNRSLLYLCWCLLFLYLLLDDSLQIHETLGVVVAQELGFSSWLGLRPEDFGELAVSAFFGLAPVLAIIILQIIYRGRRAADWSRYLLLMLGALVLTGGVFDMLHSLVFETQGRSLLELLLRVAEDGGEMVVWSTTLWIVLLLIREDLYRSKLLREEP